MIIAENDFKLYKIKLCHKCMNMNDNTHTTNTHIHPECAQFILSTRLTLFPE